MIDKVASVAFACAASFAVRASWVPGSACWLASPSAVVALGSPLVTAKVLTRVAGCRLGRLLSPFRLLETP
jgi:hypothetical protein